MGALELAQIGGLLHKTAVDDAGQANADRVHGLSARHRSNLFGETLRDSSGGRLSSGSSSGPCS